MMCSLETDISRRHTVSMFTVEKLNLSLAATGFLCSLFFDPEDGNDMFFRNVAFSPK
jgi:hypothetical protein